MGRAHTAARSHTPVNTSLSLIFVQVQTWSRSLLHTLEELECKICYNRYDCDSRKPKLLGCLHRVCARCLKKMVSVGECTCWDTDVQDSTASRFHPLGWVSCVTVSLTTEHRWKLLKRRSDHHRSDLSLLLLFPGESSSSTVTCPFCRQETRVPEDEVRPECCWGG